MGTAAEGLEKRGFIGLARGLREMEERGAFDVPIREWHWLAELLEDPLLTAGPVATAPPFGHAGRITLVAGREKTAGKSTAASAAIAQATQRGIRCLYVTLDEPPGDTVQRLERFGADTGLVAVVVIRPDDLNMILEETLAEVIVIDSLEKWVAGKVTESGDSFQWTAAMTPLQTIARTRNVAVVLLHHANKSTGTYRDSTAIGATVDVIMTLTERPDGSRRAKVQARFPVPEFTARLNKETGLIAFEYDDTEGLPTDRGPAPVELQHRVLRLLQSAEPDGLKSSTWQLLAKEEGISRASYYRARKALYDNGHASYASSLYRVSQAGARWIDRGPQP